MSSQAVPQPYPEADAPAPLSEISRIIGVFSSPKAAFTDIVARPRWYVPMILVCLASLCMITLYSQRVGFDRMMQQQMDQNPKLQSLPAEQRAQQIQAGQAIAKPFAFVFSVIGPPISVLIIAGVLMFLANSMLGSQLRYGQMSAIVAYASLSGLVAILLTIIVMFVRSPEDFNLQNPLAFNVGAFLNPDSTPKWLTSLGTSLDLFSLWDMCLIAVGIMVASRKVAFTKALMVVVIPWAIYVALKVGGAAIMS
jgi:hypothetical protein